jgi:uncharacterized protein YndB with AHSA1/START domain
MSDRIEKEILLHSSPARVWRALSDRSEFGAWFGVRFPAGTFIPGEKVRGNITYPGYEHVVMEIEIVDVEPEKRLSYRWHPYAIDPTVDFSGEEPTLVTFTLEEQEDGTLLKIVESGFDHVPLARRADAFRMNDSGWAEQTKNIERHVAAT